MRSRTLVSKLMCLVAAFLLVALVCPGWTQVQQTGWPELPDKIKAKILSPDQLGVVECPATLNEAAPSRVVMQYIMNTFYKWKEYDLGIVNGQAQFCIVMEEPVKMRLNPGDAAVLLSASEQWKEAPPSDANEAQVLEASDPQLNVPAIGKILKGDNGLSAIPAAGEDGVVGSPAKPATSAVAPAVGAPGVQSVIGSDDRTRITATTVYPWAAVSFLQVWYPGGASFRGSGSMVGPWCVLTAGHMVYDDGTNQWINSMLIAPGQRQDVAGGAVTRPWGTRTATYFMSNTGYTGGGGFDYDYGAGLFNTPFTGFSTFMPIEFNLAPGLINLAGYPPEVKGETNSQGMWWSYGPVVQILPRILRYTADTSGGNSGGPVWLYNASTGLRRQAAVHVYGSVSYNGGCRLVTANMAAVQTFMNWRPSTPPAAPTNVQATDGTYSDRILVSWNASTGATGYKVYRNTVNNSATASYRGTVTTLSYNDYQVEPGVSYYYWVKASNATGDSVFSLVNSGYRLRIYTTLTINGGLSVGNISAMGDGDWYRLVVTTPGIYVIQTWAGTLSDNYMWLYGPNNPNLLIASNDDGGPGLMANLTRTLAAGTYYIRIKPYYASVTGTYYIRVESVPSVPPLLVVNGSAVTVTCSPAGDTDTYRFVVTTAGTHTINTTAGTLSDDFMFLYGPNSQSLLLATDDDSGTGYMARISRTLNPGTYYVRLISYYGTGTGATGNFAVRVTRP